MHCNLSELNFFVGHFHYMIFLRFELSADFFIEIKQKNAISQQWSDHCSEAACIPSRATSRFQVQKTSDVRYGISLNTCLVRALATHVCVFFFFFSYSSRWVRRNLGLNLVDLLCVSNALGLPVLYTVRWGFSDCNFAAKLLTHTPLSSLHTVFLTWIGLVR